jgi:hypothetical protein
MGKLVDALEISVLWLLMGGTVIGNLVLLASALLG